MLLLLDTSTTLFVLTNPKSPNPLAYLCRQIAPMPALFRLAHYQFGGMDPQLAHILRFLEFSPTADFGVVLNISSIFELKLVGSILNTAVCFLDRALKNFHQISDKTIFFWNETFQQKNQSDNFFPMVTF